MDVDRNLCDWSRARTGPACHYCRLQQMVHRRIPSETATAESKTTTARGIPSPWQRIGRRATREGTPTSTEGRSQSKSSRPIGWRQANSQTTSLLIRPSASAPRLTMKGRETPTIFMRGGRTAWKRRCSNRPLHNQHDAVSMAVEGCSHHLLLLTIIFLSCLSSHSIAIRSYFLLRSPPMLPLHSSSPPFA